jgi:competence protein ComGC
MEIKRKFKKGISCMKFHRTESFTLVELLIVIGILAILTVAVLIYLNPVEYLKQSRDVTRGSDLQNLNSALSLVESQVPNAYFGEKNTVYVSVPDESAASSTCPTLGLPSLPVGWNYGCVDSAHLRNTNGTGWVPVNFTETVGLSFSTLPVDPVNVTSTQEYYTYTPGGSWALTALLESQKYQQIVGNTPDKTRFQIGTDLKLITSTIYGGAAPPAPVQLTVSANTSSITADKYSLDADGNSLVTFTITAKDSGGNPVSSATVVLSSNGSNNTFAQPVNTNSSGQTTGTLKSTTSENKTISVTINGIVINQTPVITFNAPCVGTDFAGTDYTATTTSLSSTADTVFCNVGTFTVPAGITLTLGATRKFEVRAVTANILGTINGVGKGYATDQGPGKATGNYGSGHGGYGYNYSSGGGISYDSATAPNDFGSGSHYVSGGGFFKLITTGVATINGVITVDGTANDASAAGGSVYISAGTLAGSGSITANGGYTGYGTQGGAGGRMAVYYITKTFSGSITAYPAGGGSTYSGAGTIFDKPASSIGTLTINSNNLVSAAYTPIPSDSLIGAVSILNRSYALASSTSIVSADVILSTSTLIMFGSNSFKSLTVNSGGTVTHNVNVSSKVNYIDLTAPNISVNSGGSINISGKGYAYNQGPGKPVTCNAGSGHGGTGAGTGGGPAYDSQTAPADLGSGGCQSGSYGGGYVKLIASGALTINGSINANALAFDAPGSGGGIYLSSGIFSGSGTISANGGATGYSNQGSGGGRIAYYYTTKTFNGTTTATNTGNAIIGTIYDAGAGSYPGPLGMIQNNNLAKKDKSENLFANILSVFSNWLK